MEGFRKMTEEIYKLNWNVFKIHVSKCVKCQSKCLVIWSHIVKEDFEK